MQTDNFLILISLKADASETTGNLTIDSITRRLVDYNTPFEIRLESFDNKVNFNYALEALPLDFLTRNNTRLLTQECNNKTKPWLKCLQSSVPLQFDICTNSYSFNLSYEFNYASEYAANGITISSQIYPFNILIQCNTIIFLFFINAVTLNWSILFLKITTYLKIL